jgi:hypothetical protein
LLPLGGSLFGPAPLARVALGHKVILLRAPTPFASMKRGRPFAPSWVTRSLCALATGSQVENGPEFAVGSP